jgi:hypothetical protein
MVELYASFDSSSTRSFPPYYVLKTVRFLELSIMFGAFNPGNVRFYDHFMIAGIQMSPAATYMVMLF